MSAFSSSEKDVIERQVDVQNKIAKLSDIWTSNDLNRCIKFIREKFLTNVCLQFSDDTLHLAVTIESELAKHVDSNIFILADTSYGSCCVDEVIFTNNLSHELYYGISYIINLRIFFVLGIWIIICRLQRVIYRRMD